MLDLLYAGWKAAQMWAQWNEKTPKTVEGSVDDVRQLREMTEALYEDNQRLIELAEAQDEQITLLRRSLGAACVILLILIAAIGLTEWFAISDLQMKLSQLKH